MGRCHVHINVWERLLHQNCRVQRQAGLQAVVLPSCVVIVVVVIVVVVVVVGIVIVITVFVIVVTIVIVVG
jgi:hypothetical protein